MFVFFFKQKTAYEMRISDWSSDVCSSDLCKTGATCPANLVGTSNSDQASALTAFNNIVNRMRLFMPEIGSANVTIDYDYSGLGYAGDPNGRSEEHTSELQSLMRISYAVFCLKKNKKTINY